jgi:hypothetical protein
VSDNALLEEVQRIVPLSLNTFKQGGASAWEKVVGVAQDFNVPLRMLYGDEQWVLRNDY